MPLPKALTIFLAYNPYDTRTSTDKWKTKNHKSILIKSN